MCNLYQVQNIFTKIDIYYIYLIIGDTLKTVAFNLCCQAWWIAGTNYLLCNTNKLVPLHK